MNVKDASSLVGKVWDFLKPPPSDDPAEHRWRWHIALIVVGLFAFLLAQMFFTGAWPWGGRVAKAAQIDDLDDKIGKIADQVTGSYKIVLAQEICRLYFLRESARGDTHEALSDAYETKQTEYADLNKGVRYPVQECSRPADG